MTTNKHLRNVYAVIPAAVRYDPELRPNAKLLYGELSALTISEGYCWASNAYFAELFNLSKKTVEALIRQLKDRGHIRIETERDPKTQEVIRRKIWISGPPGTSAPPPLDFEGTSPHFRGDPPLDFGPLNNVDNNKYNIPPIVPRGDRAANDGPSLPRWRPSVFLEFWDFYRSNCRGEARKAACRAWDKLKPSPELMAQIYAGLKVQMASEEWRRGIGVPYCSSYLNGRRWEDVLPASVTATTGTEECEDGWE